MIQYVNNSNPLQLQLSRICLYNIYILTLHIPRNYTEFCIKYKDMIIIHSLFIIVYRLYVIFPGYQSYHSVREKSRPSGGVSILIDNKIQSRKLDE